MDMDWLCGFWPAWRWPGRVRGGRRYRHVMDWGICSSRSRTWAPWPLCKVDLSFAMALMQRNAPHILAPQQQQQQHRRRHHHLHALDSATDGPRHARPGQTKHSRQSFPSVAHRPMASGRGTPDPQQLCPACRHGVRAWLASRTLRDVSCSRDALFLLPFRGVQEGHAREREQLARFGSCGHGLASHPCDAVTGRVLLGST